ncbi:MAG: RNA-binding protein [Planctomycetota bacterium]|jgi:hypothetical protein
MRMFAAYLSKRVSVMDMWGAFEAFGRVMDVVLVRTRLTDLSGGAAFFALPVRSEGMSAILEMDGFILSGQSMAVDEARTGPAV